MSDRALHMRSSGSTTRPADPRGSPTTTWSVLRSVSSIARQVLTRSHVPLATAQRGPSCACTNPCVCCVAVLASLSEARVNTSPRRMQQSPCFIDLPPPYMCRCSRTSTPLTRHALHSLTSMCQRFGWPHPVGPCDIDFVRGVTAPGARTGVSSWLRSPFSSLTTIRITSS
jgi:hypothetical protein